MSVLLVSLRRREEGAWLFKKRLGFGWGQWAHVACGRGIRCVVAGSHRRCCGWLCLRIISCEGGMSKECGPSGEQGSGDGLAQGFWAVASSGFGELADELCCFFAPTASCFNSKNDQAVATCLDKFWARPFFGPSHVP